VIILGLNCFHGDAAAALFRDGKLVAAAEEERFCRIKHYAGFPWQSIAFCLGQARVRLADVDHVAVNQDSRANLAGKLRYIVARRPDLALILDRVRNRRSRAGLTEWLTQHFPGQSFGGRIHAVEHHLAHLASAFQVSPFREAAVVSVDGFGDFASAAWGIGREAQISVDGRIHFPHSLGVFYQAITQYLGFLNYGDEYKVMGLAPYGAPAFMPQMRRIVRLEPGGRFKLDLSFFRHHRQAIEDASADGAPQFRDLFAPALEELLGPRRQPEEDIEERHRDVASSAQAIYEEALFHLLRSVQERSGLTDLALAGGCAQNSVANGKIRANTGFRRLYVPPAAGDAGGAIGAAAALWHELGGARRFVMDHAYWGPQFGDGEFGDLLAEQQGRIEEAACRIEEIRDDAELCRQTALAIAAGKVVGWFQGRMEWGPRALGNRSILGDPRRGDMKDILNAKIKRRESFRPFAPSVLEEAVPDWFEEEGAVPFMGQVFQIRRAKRRFIPAVTHVDGSGRLQTVARRTNPLFYEVIAAFRDLTGVPMVLNTSFNENEPIVCEPDEALDCFLRTRMDVLVLGPMMIARAATRAFEYGAADVAGLR
jgi:carbamoyltransferase